MPSTTRTLTDRLAKFRQALPENDPALAMHRDQRLMLHFVLAVQATRWPADLREDDPTLDQPAVPGYLSPTHRAFRDFVRVELSAIERPEPIPSERVFVALFLWANFLDLLNAPPPDPPRDCPQTWQQLSSQPLRPSSRLIAILAE